MEAIRPEDIKRLSSLEDAGVRGGIHSQHTWLVALHDGSLWIAKKTGTEERDEIFVYLLAQKMFRGVVPETVPGYIPKIGWVSMQRKVSGVPAGRVDGLHGYMHGNEEMQADLVSMIVMDYLVGNPDRHSNNWFLMHNDRLAAIDNGWAGEENTLPLSAVFQPADLAGLVRDEALWPKMLKMMLELINDLTGRGDEARALAEEIDINQKDAVDMVRLWEPKLQRLARFVQTEASKLQKEKVYITRDEQPPLGVRMEEGPRGGHYYESEGIPIATDKPRGWGKDEDPAAIAEWARQHGGAPDTDALDFNSFQGDLDELFKWVEEATINTDEEAKEFFEQAWTTEVTTAEITRFSSDEDTIEVTVKLTDPETGKSVGNMMRTLNKNGEVHHDMFTIKSSAQGQGLALAVNRQAEEAYRDMGFYGISLSADINIGKYAWAQQGYNFADEYEKSTAWERLIEFQWENGGYDKWAGEAQDRVEDAHTEEWNGADTDEERQWADDRREEGLTEIRDYTNAPPDAFVEERQQEQYEQGYDAWDLASLDDGEKYGEYPLGKAFMLSDYMDEWKAYKDLTPDSTHSRVGDVYWDKKKHKIAGKKKKVVEYAHMQGEALRQEQRKKEWVAETIEPVQQRVREMMERTSEEATEKAWELRKTLENVYGKLTPAQQKVHNKANKIIQESNERTHAAWERYEDWARKKTAAAGFGPEGALPREEPQQVAAMRKAEEGGRIP
ncbi:hypothetical protein LCGC14_1772060, partial [marine sediment metagenome]